MGRWVAHRLGRTDSVTEVSAGSLACFTAVQITEYLLRRGKFVSLHPVSQCAPCSPLRKQRH